MKHKNARSGRFRNNCQLLNFSLNLNLQVLREFGKYVEDDPLSSKFIDITYQPVGIVEKLLPSIPQFVMISGMILISTGAIILNNFWSM